MRRAAWPYTVEAMADKWVPKGIRVHKGAEFLSRDLDLRVNFSRPELQILAGLSERSSVHPMGAENARPKYEYKVSLHGAPHHPVELALDPPSASISAARGERGGCLKMSNEPLAREDRLSACGLALRHWLGRTRLPDAVPAPSVRASLARRRRCRTADAGSAGKSQD
jgi:hypothetical protein